MSDNIDIPVTASGADGVERLVSALDRLHAAMSGLGSNASGLGRLEQQVQAMQQSMTNGFAEMAAMAKKGEAAVVGSAERAASSVLSIEQRRDTELNKIRQQELTSRVAWWNKVLDMQERRDAELNAASAKAASEYVRWWEKAAAERVAIEQRRDVELHAARAREHQDYTAWWAKTLSTQEAAQTRQLEMERNQQVALATLRATAAEKQRALNTGFITSPLSSQIATAEKAKVYGSLGGNAAEKYGTIAATADLAALRKQHELLPAAIRNSQGATGAHNEAMREAHSLARGLTGSLGGLWLTYGSLVPLAAGAAIATSLKNLVTAGRDVEYSLKFVEALGGGKVNLDSFLAITDTTVVSVKEAAEGMRALAQNGLNATQALQALPSVLNLAVIGELSVSQAALSATGAMSAFGLKIQDLDRVGDIFAQTAATSNTSVSAMTESMRQASTVAAVYGSTIEETAAALGILAKINVTGSAAGTAYTNMLTNLYSPTKQAAAALKELKVTTDDGMGGLKNSTQLLTELRQALSQYNEPARADILGDIFTVRGQKAASTIIESLDVYKKKIEEAQNASGFMGRAVSVLEDTTTGAFKRLSNSVSDSLNRAFASSGPALQELIMHLATVARSDGVVKILTYMADGAIRLTKTIVDWAGAMAIAAGGLVALRIIGGITTMLSTYSAAATVATTATARWAAGMTLLNASLGWIGLAIGIAVAAWQLFISTTSDVEKANTRIQNSIETNIEYLERETKALEERNKAWNPETQRFDKKVTPDTVDADQAVAKRISEREKSIAQLRESVNKGIANDTLRAGSTLALSKLEQAQAADKALLWKQTAMAESLAVAQSEESYRKEKAQVLDSIALLVEKGKVSKTIAGAEVPIDPLGNEKSRAIALSAIDLDKRVKAGTLDAKQAKIELMAIEQEYNKALAGRAGKSKGPSSGSILNGDLKEQQLQVDLQRQLTQYETTMARGQYERGEIGELQLVNKELAAKADLRKVELDVARQQAAMADKANKPGKEQKYTNRSALASKQALFDDLEAANKRATVAKRLQDDITQHEVASLTDRGQLVDAFTLDFEAKYGKALRGLNSDIGFESDPAMKALMQKWRDTLGQMEEDGKNAALGKQLGGEITEMLSSLDQAFNRVGNDAAGGSLGQMFESALAAAQALDEALPGLVQKQRELQAQADISQKPEDQTRATRALKDIDNAASRMRKVWTDVGTAIGKSLGGAFERAGKSVGQLVSIYTTYGAKQKEIQDNLKRDVAADPEKRAKLEQKATEESSRLQIKAYGDMAGAAKGFFKEKTGAYRALEATEKAFRAYELAMEIKNFAVKSGLVAAFTGLFVTSKVVQTGAEGTSTAASILMAGMQATAWGITAVVKAIASMPFPANLVAGAVTLAAVVGIGAKIAGSFGGGGGVNAKERQEKNGTGSILGDDKAKSESISKALKMVQENTYQGLAVSHAMLNSLRAIEAGLAGVGNILAQNGVTGTAPATKQGAAYKIGETVSGGNGLAGLVLAGPLFAGLDKLTGGWISRTTGKIANALFGGKTSAQDVGLTANKTSVAGALAGGMNPVSYADMKRDGGIFRSDKYYTDTTGLGAEANQQFTMIIKGMADTITQASVMMGVGGAEFQQRLNAFVIDIGKISTKDLKPEEIQAQLAAAFSKVGDDMARWALGDLTKFQKVGEGAFETLARVAQDYQAVEVVFASFGKTFGQVGLESINARERLIELSGGLDEFLSQGSYFLENFYSEQERADKLKARIQPTLSQYGLQASGATAMQDFRKYIEGLDTTSAAGAQAYAQLMLVAPALKSIADAAGDAVKSADEILSERKDLLDQIDDLIMTETQLRAKERNELDASNRALYDQLQAAKGVADARDRLTQAYENEQNTIEETITRLGGLADSWKDFQHDLVMGDKSTLTPQQKYLEAQTKYEETLAAARGGDTKAQDAYQSVAQEFLDASRTVNSSGAAYTKDFDGVLQATKENEVWARAQVDSAKASLDVLKSQAASLISIDEKIGTWAEEQANFARMQAEYMQRAAAAAVPGNQSSTTGTTSVESMSTAQKMEEMVEQLKALREQQAQENSDNIDSNVEATLAAAEALAQAARDAQTNRGWYDRSQAYAR